MKKVAIFNDTRSDRGHYGCRIVMNNLFSLLRQNDMEPVFSLPFDKDWQDVSSNIPSKDQIDAIIVNAEGSMHSSATRERATSLAKLGRFSKEHYGIPAFVVNATFHNNNQMFYDEMRYFNGVFVRDTASKIECENFGINCYVVPDLSLSVDRQHGNDRQGFGITDSVKGRDNRDLRIFARQNNVDFRAMVTPNAQNFSFHQTLRPIKCLRNYIQSRHDNANRFTSEQDFVEWIASKELIITGRYHTVTVCMLTRTPFVYLESNTPKITSLLSDANLNPARLLQNINEITKLQNINRHQFSREEEVSLENFLSHASTAANTMFGTIRKSISEAT